MEKPKKHRAKGFPIDGSAIGSSQGTLIMMSFEGQRVHSFPDTKLYSIGFVYIPFDMLINVHRVRQIGLKLLL